LFDYYAEESLPVENSEFLLSCILAFAIVFLVLSILAISIRLLITVFPEKSDQDDPAVVAAVTSHLNRIYPRLQITKMEELK
jgi:hypothetical protein